jgi:hypothetical protein
VPLDRAAEAVLVVVVFGSGDERLICHAEMVVLGGPISDE